MLSLENEGQKEDVPGFTALIYHGRLGTIKFAINIPCGEESDNSGYGNQRVTCYTLRSCLACGIMN
jgi:hypothetical protein